MDAPVKPAHDGWVSKPDIRPARPGAGPWQRIPVPSMEPITGLCFSLAAAQKMSIGVASWEAAMSLGMILIIILIILLLGGFSGRFGGYGYGMGHSGMGLGGVILVVLLILLLLGKL